MISIKNKDEIKLMARACEIVRDTLFLLEEKIHPGISTNELDKIAENYILSQGAELGFKGLYGYPSTICISIEDEVVHGLPSDKKLSEGQIVGIDVGSIYEGFYGDHAKTFCVGSVSDEKNLSQEMSSEIAQKIVNPLLKEMKAKCEDFLGNITVNTICETAKKKKIQKLVNKKADFVI